MTRRVLKDKAKYFGPYPNAYAAQQTKKLLDRMYPLRKCGVMPKEVCLYYHMGKCLAPCVKEIPKSAYEQITGEITSFLSGGHEEIKKERAQDAGGRGGFVFRASQRAEDQIIHIDTLMEKQKITTTDTRDRDVFGYAVDKGWMCVQILYMRQGKMVRRNKSVFPFYGDAHSDFMSFIAQYYSDNPALPQEILLPEPLLIEQADSEPVTGTAADAGVRSPEEAVDSANPLSAGTLMRRGRLAQAQEEQAEARASWMQPRGRRPAGMARREGACAAPRLEEADGGHGIG